MCTRVLWSAGDQRVLVGRNMDWKSDLRTNLWVMPRGVERTGIDGDPNPLTWTSRYGSVVATVYDAAVADGVNEKGLAGHILWLAEADFGDRDTALPAVSVSVWLQMFLDRFATVAECVEVMRTQPFQVRGQEMRGTEGATIHLALDDATGDSAVIEYIDGEPVVHHGREYTVMTNSPPFDEQLDHLKRYDGFGGDRPLPGTTLPADRFVRAAYYAARLPREEDRDRSYAALLSVMRNAAQPFGTSDPARPNVSETIWRTLSDLTERVYAFESSFRPFPVWARLGGLDFSRTAKVDLAGSGLSGDVTDRFVPTEPLSFASA
jgi:choloylglycine hydrolase